MAEDRGGPREIDRLEELERLTHEELERVVDRRAIGEPVSVEIEAQRPNTLVYELRHEEIELPERHRSAVQEYQRQRISGTFEPIVRDAVTELRAPPAVRAARGHEPRSFALAHGRLDTPARRAEQAADAARE